MRHALFFIAMIGCSTTQAGPAECPTGGEAPACLGLGASTSVPRGGARSIDGSPLALCSAEPLTGAFRDGHCRTDERDRGVHVVCASMTEAFLTFTRGRGNDLSTAKPQYGFPGLREGDRWCLCAARWEEARRAGYAPPVVLEATDEAALRYSPSEALRAHQLDAPGVLTPRPERSR